MTFKKHEWNAVPILAIQRKIMRFNELNQNYKPKRPKKKPVTWGQAYRDAIRHFEKLGLSDKKTKSKRQQA